MSFVKNNKYQILTPEGFCDFVGINKQFSQNVVTVQFDDTTSVSCTDNHRFLLDTGRWCQAKRLKSKIVRFADGGVKHVVSVHQAADEYVFDIVGVANKKQWFIINNGLISHNSQVIDEFWNSVMPVISSSNKTQIFVVSTPNGTQNKFYELYTMAERGESNWHAERVDWWEVPGRSERWRKRMVDDLGSSERFDQEFGNQFVEVGQSPFSKEVFDELRQSKMEPKFSFVDTPDGFEPQETHDEFTTYRVWKEALPKHTYSIGVDVGEGVGRAASVIAVLDLTDLTNIELVAMYHNRRIQPVQFATKILRIAQHYGNPNVLVERNNCGGQVIDSLYNIHQYTRLVDYSPTNPNQKYYNRLGVYSHSNSKYKGITNMRYWFDQLRACRVYDIATVHEFETFVRHPNGTWSHQAGEHIYDDRVMAIVWGLFLLEKEIAEKYVTVIEYDATGRPARIEDPYGETIHSDPLVRSSQRSLFGNSLSAPSISMVGQRNQNSHASDDMAELLAAGWQPFNR